MDTAPAYWRKCSACKKPIALNAVYYVCSVSTCNGQRTGYAFCSVLCFEAHLPGARHRDAGAVEKRAPSTPAAAEGIEASQPANAAAASSGSKRVLATTSGSAATASGASSPTRQPIPREILVVVSKVKDYIRARSEMNTSDAVMPLLSERIREICDEAIDAARQEGRKTVLDRDVPRKK